MSVKYDDITSALLPKFMQVPYKHGGRSFRGADCWGVIVLWYKWRLCQPVWDINESYPRSKEWSDRNYFIENYHREWEKVLSPHPHDVVLLRNGERVDHAGIYLGQDRIMHMYRRSCVISKVTADPWKNRVEGYYHLRRRDAGHR